MGGGGGGLNMFVITQSLSYLNRERSNNTTNENLNMLKRAQLIGSHRAHENNKQKCK